jgi:MFS superfamily sulfate permease-like transporter
MAKDNFTANLKSGFFISLIALPLCLGIAIASSCPPIAGVITAIVGGIITSFISGCRLSIKGPAAGLIVIVLACVVELGGDDAVLGYKRMLAVGVVAASLQIVFALMNLPRFGRLMPPSVIHGMLAAIGVIIIAKQFHVLLGAHPFGKTHFALISEIPNSIMNFNPELAFIGVFTLALMIILPFIPSRFLKTVPPALLALFVVIPLSLYWHLDSVHNYNFFDHNYSVGPQYLVNIPSSILSSLVFPDFSILMSPIAYKYVIMLSLVGSIESVLTVIAVDSITKAKSNLNRDLLGLGIANFIAAMLGGLPMISEVVRSRANIDSGARDQWSNFFHGVFLLIFVSLLVPVIKEIPLAALAGMLMVTGYRLCSPRQLLNTGKMGVDQLSMFITTLLVTLATDLLTGIVAGCVLKLIFHLIRGVKVRSFFSIVADVEENPHSTRVIIRGPAVFTNYLSLQKKLHEAKVKSDVIIVDFSQSSLIDHTTLSCLNSLKEEWGEKQFSLIGLDKLARMSKHQLSTHRLV